MLKDKLKVTGKVELINAKGDVVRHANLVVDVGKAWIANRITGAANPMTHIAAGTGSAAAAAGNTALGVEIFRKAVTVAGGTPSSNTVAFEVTFAAGEATGALTEVGLFDAASNGTMLARSVFAEYNKGALDLLTIRWTITVS